MEAEADMPTRNDGVIWRDIPGYEGIYLLGNNRVVFRTKTRRGTGCGPVKAWLVEGKYERVTLSKDGRQQCLYVDSLMAIVWPELGDAK